MQVFHREVLVLSVTRERWNWDSHGRNQTVGKAQSCALASEVALQFARQTGHGEGDGIVVQTGKKVCRLSFFFQPHSGVNLCHIDGAAGQNVAILNETMQELAPILLFVDGVDDDAGIEEESSH